MTQPLTLYLPLATFEALHKVVDGRGKVCKVSKRDLRALLMDHSRTLAKLADMKVETEEVRA
jgi:hypothetical protein